MKKVSWKDLTKKNTYSAIYISFYNQSKTQEIAAREIYMKKTNEKPVRDAIGRLIEAEYLKVTDFKSARLIYFKSTTKPLIEFIKFKLEEHSKGSKRESPEEFYNVSDEEEKAVEMILDSKWFRDFIGFKVMYPHYDFYKTLKNKIVVSNALQMVCDILGVITTLNLIFGRIPSINGKMQTMSDILNAKSFDALGEDMSKRLSKSEKSIILSAIMKSNLREEIKEDLKKYTQSMHFLCIPSELSAKLTRLGRLETEGTIIEGLDNSIKKLLNKNKS